MASVRKLDRVMMALAYMWIDRVELTDAIGDGLGPEPAVAIFYLFGEGQFGSFAKLALVASGLNAVVTDGGLSEPGSGKFTINPS